MRPTRPRTGRSSEEIGYLVPEGPPFQVDTANVDPEIAAVSGPQLVVPISNARYALNAANARWGSLYDALYGSDAIPRDGLAASEGYDPERGRQVIAWTRRFLDDVVPLASGSHAGVKAYSVRDGRLAASLGDGTTVALAEPAKFRRLSWRRGRAGARSPRQQRAPHRDRHRPRASGRPHDDAGVADVVLEAALTTIMDLEDFDRRG